MVRDVRRRHQEIGGDVRTIVGDDEDATDAMSKVVAALDSLRSNVFRQLRLGVAVACTTDILSRWRPKNWVAVSRVGHSLTD